MPPERPEPPVFAAPWQAQAFALAVALAEAGHFTWSEWAATLGRHLGRADADPTGDDYFEHWLAALEALLAEKQIALPADVERLAAAWERAAHATPHGRPILLENDPGAP